MAYSAVPTRSTTDANSFADINQLQENITCLTPVGVSYSYNGIDLPDSFLWEDGSSVSRTTYATLYAVLTKSLGTVTFTNATEICNLNSHGLATGDCIEFTNSGGALPPELTANTNYFVIYVSANTFKMATTLANALAGTNLTISGDGTGTHTLRHCPWGIDGANNFLLPDKRGVSEEGKGQQGTAAWASANYLGGLGQYKQDQFQAFYISDNFLDTGAAVAGGANYQNGAANKSPITDGIHGTPRTGYITAGPRVGVNKIIRYQ